MSCGHAECAGFVLCQRLEATAVAPSRNFFDVTVRALEVKEGDVVIIHTPKLSAAQHEMIARAWRDACESRPTMRRAVFLLLPLGEPFSVEKLSSSQRAHLVEELTRKKM